MSDEPTINKMEKSNENGETAIKKVENSNENEDQSHKTFTMRELINRLDETENDQWQGPHRVEENDLKNRFKGSVMMESWKQVNRKMADCLEEQLLMTTRGKIRGRPTRKSCT